MTEGEMLKVTVPESAAVQSGEKESRETGVPCKHRSYEIRQNLNIESSKLLKCLVISVSNVICLCSSLHK